jgi:NAD(P)H-dependent FMN reductase
VTPPMIMCTRPPAGRLVASRYSRGLLADRTPPYLSNKPVGLVSTAGGVQGLQTINSMDFIARALRAWSVPTRAASAAFTEGSCDYADDRQFQPDGPAR